MPGQPAVGLPVVRTDGNIGLSLDEVAEALERLPGGRTPNKSDWASCPGSGGHGSTSRSPRSKRCGTAGRLHRVWLPVAQAVRDRQPV
jgi:hypothetical protein